MNQFYTTALELEEKKFFSSAFEKFQQYLKQNIGRRGEVLFHCGWCIEGQFGYLCEEALVYYMEGAESSFENICKMNCYFRAGWIFMYLKNYDKAAVNFFRSRQIGIENRLTNSIYAEATYWLVICLEAQNHYLDALKLYNEIESETCVTALESRWWVICCLNQIGFYDQALEACNRFDEMNSEGFDADRFDELSRLVDKEKEILTQLIFV